MRILTPLDGGASLAGGGTQAADFPVANVLTDLPGDAWVTTSMSNQSVLIDLGVAQPITDVAVLFTNLTASATITVAAGSSAGSQTALQTVAPANGAGVAVDEDWRDFYHNFPAAQSFRYWRFDLSDAGNPAGFFSIGRIVLDSGLSTPHDYGVDSVPEDYALSVEAPDGRFIPGQLQLGKRIDFSVGLMPQADVNGGWNRILRRGRSRPVLVVQDPDASAIRQRGMVYGVVTQRPSVARAYNAYSSGKFSVRGLLP